jgi:hypothetical protein
MFGKKTTLHDLFERFLDRYKQDRSWLDMALRGVEEETRPGDDAPWVELGDNIDVLGRIEDFLTVQELHGPSPQLARDCREDLDLLLVMVDYCLDQGQPLAAEEARYLHSLASALVS